MASAASGSDDGHKVQGQKSPLASQRDQNASPKANRAGRFGGYFTLGYKEGFSQWWANIPAATAERNVLSFVPYLQTPPTQTKSGSLPPRPSTADGTDMPSDSSLQRAASVTTDAKDDPYGPRQWDSKLVQLSGKNRGLNEFSVERTGEIHDQNLVILHGYGAGLGFFYKNFESLSRALGWKIYALDLLGMGRSTRPPFKIYAKDRAASITEAENWFIDALEEWRVQRRIERFTLLGHSLGGYMAVAYALKYPGHLNKLILASPVGIPEDPYAVDAALPEPQTSMLGAEFTQSQDDTTNAASPNLRPTADNNNFLNARSKAEARPTASSPTSSTASTAQPPSPARRPLPKWLTYLWDANISPFSLVRWSGPLGPRFVSGWTSRRFSHLPPDEGHALHAYAYSLFKQRGSGEYALAYVLAPGAFARSPLIRRIAGVGRQVVERRSEAAGREEGALRASADGKGKRETGIPIVLMYGENDWMDVTGGHAAVEKINEEKKKAVEAARKEGRSTVDGGEAKVVIIKKAGHHLYLDGWEEFNSVMLEEMADVRRRETEREKGQNTGAGAS